MTMNTKKITEYSVEPGTNIRVAIEDAIVLARANNAGVIVQMNGARFAVKPDTKLQDAIDDYLAVKKKMFETQQKLNQNKR